MTSLEVFVLFLILAYVVLVVIVIGMDRHVRRLERLIAVMNAENYPPQDYDEGETPAFLKRQAD